MNHSTTGLPCPSPTPGVHPNPCASSQWCHPTISSSLISFSSCTQYFPAWGSFQMSHSVMSNSLQHHGLYSPWNSPGQNTRVGSHFLLQGIFQTQRLNQGFPHYRQILYQLSQKGNPRILRWVASPSSSGSPNPGIKQGSIELLELAKFGVLITKCPLQMTIIYTTVGKYPLEEME